MPFTVGALGCAAMLGLGNGAVFKLVPLFFPANTATVTGLVGAMGGLGGFFPPLMLGAFRDALGVIWPGWVLLAAMAASMWAMNQLLFMTRQKALETETAPQFSRAAERVRAGALATLLTALLIASIVVGSRNLQNFDPALVIYTFAVIFATWGIVYHYAVWLNKPPTRRFFERSWSLVFSQGVLHSAVVIAKAAVTHIFAQTFIGRRSRVRWWMHQCLFWGCLLAVAITFPLVFGWIYFRSAPDNQMRYVTYLFGFPTGSFALQTVTSWLLFHGLDIAAILVLAGISLALWRRMRDEGALTLQDFSMDFLPLILLFAICVTGLALTVSAMWFRGEFYAFLSILHAITVIGGLLFLPFGKFFHVFQRPAQLGVKLSTRMPVRKVLAQSVHGAGSVMRRVCRLTICSESCRHLDSTTEWTDRLDIGRPYAQRASARPLRPHNYDSRRNYMAKELTLTEDLLERYGPNLNYTPPGGWEKNNALDQRNWSKRTVRFADSSAEFN